VLQVCQCVEVCVDVDKVSRMWSGCRNMCCRNVVRIEMSNVGSKQSFLTCRHVHALTGIGRQPRPSELHRAADESMCARTWAGEWRSFAKCVHTCDRSKKVPGKQTHIQWALSHPRLHSLCYSRSLFMSLPHLSSSCPGSPCHAPDALPPVSCIRPLSPQHLTHLAQCHLRFYFLSSFHQPPSAQ
jgi:hypothetical protein